MTKLLIVDDEPLAQLGINSMLDWSIYDITVIGTASNGAEALKIIESSRPEIVIADIKMPVMDGLELARRCREQFGKLPLFILLTSYEEFQLVKTAITYGVIEYLSKLELNKDDLTAALKKALRIIAEIHERQSYSSQFMDHYRDKFFIRLIHNLFDSEEQFQVQAKNLNLTFDALSYAVASCRFQLTSSSQQTEVCLHAVRMIQEMSQKHGCFAVGLDTAHFCLLFCFSEEDSQHREISRMERMLTDICTMIHSYFSLTITAAVGNIVNNPLQISDSYQFARQLLPLTAPEKPLLFFDAMGDNLFFKTVFNISLFRDNLRKAFEEYDTSALYDTFTELIILFRQHPEHYAQALDAACNILYLVISLFPNGEKAAHDIFSTAKTGSSPEEANGYLSVYNKKTTSEIADWLEQLRDGLIHILDDSRMLYRNHTVAYVQKYIQEHIREHLTLNEVATVFSISPSYLSSLFTKHVGVNFTEYVNEQKVEEAKRLFRSPKEYRIYEVADMLGYGNAFYFSRVFRKYAGYSPSEYLSETSPQR